MSPDPLRSDLNPDLTRDGFLGDRLMLWQPKTGYRAGADAVLLAAATPAQTGQSVLELGCGAGAASLCLGARVAGLRLTGVEIQPAYADLARENAAQNQLPLTVVTADLAALPAPLQAQAFDHVLMNPPYFRRDRGRAAADPGRETAFGEATPLAEWIATGARRLRPGGWLTLIHRAERLDAILAALDGRMGSVMIQPLAPRAGRPARNVILRARKGGRAPLRLLAPFILHEGDSHPGDRPHFTARAHAILAEGAALEMDC